MAIAEVLRCLVVRDLFEISTVQRCWPIWQQHYRHQHPLSAAGLLQMGGDLGHILATTNNSGRNQSSQSSAGTAWEALVCWYLNLCLVGTRAVVVKKTSHLPSPIRDAITVSYGTVRTNSESDLVAITFPEDPALDGFSGNYSGIKKKQLDAHIAVLFGGVEICVVQCKTNWNENAQIPMLWDMIYSATGFIGSRASVGTNGHSLRSAARFSYAFATIPSNPLAKFKATGLPVLRLNNLSGGNFWGQPSKHGVASSLGEIFNRNFQTATQGLGQPWQNHLSTELGKIASTYSYFNY